MRGKIQDDYWNGQDDNWNGQDWLGGQREVTRLKKSKLSDMTGKTEPKTRNNSRDEK